MTTPGTTSKESKIKLTLSDLTCNVFPDIDWLQDLEIFAKSPPGVSLIHKPFYVIFRLFSDV